MALFGYQMADFFDPTRMFGKGKDPWSTVTNKAGSPLTFNADGSLAGMTGEGMGKLGGAFGTLGKSLSGSSGAGAGGFSAPAAPPPPAAEDPGQLAQMFKALLAKRMQQPVATDPTAAPWMPKRSF